VERWHKEVIFHDGDHFFSDLLLTIASAKEAIDLETYIFDRDQLGFSVISALGEAVARGVRVRVLLDGFGCAHWLLRHIAELRGRGVQVKVYHPLPWQVSKLRFFSSLGFNRLTKLLWTVNRRNHRKCCIIDERIAFVGSMNISARHVSKLYGNKAWRDTSVRVEGAGVTYLQESFERLWNRRRIRYRREAYALIRVNSNYFVRRRLYRDLIGRIVNSKRMVWIATPYFAPDILFLRALAYAALTKKDVRVLLPSRNDVWFMKWMARAYYSVLLRFGVRVFEYYPSVLHAKILMVDDWAVVGSSNMNHRSLIHDFELDVILAKPESLKELRDQFIKDLQVSKEILFLRWKKRTLWMRFFEFLILRLRYWV
jgi:cardiolipin synthase A/B